MAEPLGPDVGTRRDPLYRPHLVEDPGEALVDGPVEVESVGEADAILESVRCDCGNGEMEEVSARKTRTKRKPHRHFERHFFRCTSCGSERTVFLDVTARRRLSGV